MPWNDNPELRENLNPWRVVLTCLLDKLDSYDIPAIIDKSGMEVNWMLTDREDYSDKYRKHAYRPRIVQAYNALTNDDRLRVCLIVTKELALGGFNKQLNADLARIGWQIENDRLSPANQRGAWDAWREAVHEEVKPDYVSWFKYSLTGIKLLPEIHYLTDLSPSGRMNLSRLVLAMLESWSASVLVHK